MVILTRKGSRDSVTKESIDKVQPVQQATKKRRSSKDIKEDIQSAEVGSARKRRSSKDVKEDIQNLEIGSTKKKKVKKFLLKDNPEELEEEEKKVEVYPNKLEDYIKDKKTIEILNKKGIKYFFPIQEQCYRLIYEGKDLIGKDRTGSGKTLAYALPLVEKMREQKKFQSLPRRQRPYVLILLPTRELSIQVFNELRSISHFENEFRVVNVYGGTELRPQCDALRAGCEIVVGTPGRIQDLYERGVLGFEELVTVILDEADQMLNFNFQEDIEKIFGTISKDKKNQKTQNLLFSATIPPWVHEISQKYLDKERAYVDLVKTNTIQTSTTVEHLAINCPFQQRIDAIGDVVLCYGGGVHSRCIIFCETKKEANEIMLKGNIKQDAQVLHGDIPQKQREITFKGFREGKFKCLIATNVASRGLDIPEVDLIVQCDPPKDFETYIHRSGRTARAGRKGVCITFYSKKTQPLLERIEYKAKIKFKRVGAPQPEDIIKASVTDIGVSLRKVSKEVLKLFIDVARSLIEEVGAEEALARALAYISGYTDKLKQRSLLCSQEGFVTYEVLSKKEFNTNGYVWRFLKDQFTPALTDKILFMKRFKDNKGVVFDVPEEVKSELDQYIEKYEKGEIRNGMEVKVAQEIPELGEDNYATGGSSANIIQSRNGSSRGTFDKGNYQKKKREQEIFIGGLPYDAADDEIKRFFEKNSVNLDELRTLKDEQGKFRGICFGMCSTPEDVKKAINLNGKPFGSRYIRINMANDKPSK